MRIALASLLVLAGANAAAAQDAASPAAPEAAPPAAVAPASAAPAAPAMEAPAPAAETPPPPPPPPTLPTTGDGAAVLSALERICVPAVRGGDLEQLAKAQGFKKDRRSGGWTARLGDERNYTILIRPLGSNTDVCQMEVHYAIDAEKPIVNALNLWAFLHEPELQMQSNYVNVDPDNIKRTKTSWEYFTDKESIGLVFNQLKNPDGSPINRRYDVGMVRYQERKF